jgi:hypothetical protein
MDMLCSLGHPLHRPRTTSHAARDTGDVHGLPFVVSVKAHRALALAAWVDELGAMVDRSPWTTGVVVHKRAGASSARRWYVTMNGRLFLPFAAAYLASGSLDIDGSEGITSRVNGR